LFSETKIKLIKPGRKDISLLVDKKSGSDFPACPACRPAGFEILHNLSSKMLNNPLYD